MRPLAGHTNSYHPYAAEEAYAVEIEFSGEPWPPLEQVIAAMRASRAALAAHGLS